MIRQASHSDIQGAAPQIPDLSRGIPAYGRDKFASGKFTSPNAHWLSKGQPMLVRGSAPKTLGHLLKDYDCRKGSLAIVCSFW